MRTIVITYDETFGVYNIACMQDLKIVQKHTAIHHDEIGTRVYYWMVLGNHSPTEEQIEDAQ